jgi:ectoine hydroxylase-related dioxygenase (phytanoyl-CoA dioxygenase family)
MKFTPEQLRLLPSDENVAFYRRHGYYISPKIFDEDELDDFVYSMERYYSGERDYRLPSAVKAFEGWRPEDGDVLRVNDYVSLQSEGLSSLVRHPMIAATAARLSGSRTIRLWHDQMIYKPSDPEGVRTGIGWHTDRAYWQTCSSDDMLTAWIPFHDCSEEMGTLMVIDGSHVWPEQSILKRFHNSAPEGINETCIGEGRPIVIVPLSLSKGQVSFHHCLTVHGSRPNRSNLPRRSLSVHLQGGDNCYRICKERNGEAVWHRNDMLCRVVDGVPDYADPDFCPVLWPEDPAPESASW